MTNNYRGNSRITAKANDRAGAGDQHHGNGLKCTQAKAGHPFKAGD